MSGGWTTRKIEVDGRRICERRGVGLRVIGVAKTPLEGSAEANAQLWAAAPELYEALAQILEDPDMLMIEVGLRTKARAALAKARGEQS
jgi:hypothetical protein